MVATSCDRTGSRTEMIFYDEALIEVKEGFKRLIDAKDWLTGKYPANWLNVTAS